MKIKWKKVLYYFLAFDFLFAIKSCNLSPENEAKEIKKSIKESQDSLTLTGLVTKNNSITPIPFCDVTLFDLDSMVIARTTSDFNGCYSFPNITHQKYILGFSRLGYQTNFIEIILQRDTNIKTSLLSNQQKKNKSQTSILCYISSESILEDDIQSIDDFFNDINIKQDTFYDKKESDVNDSLID